MPRVMRRAHRRRAAWGKGHIHQLLTGHGWFRGESFGNESRGTLDLDLMRIAWAELGEELLVDWIAEHPGARPYAWWLLAAPEKRMRIGSCVLKPGRKRSGAEDDDYRFVEDGKPHPFDGAERKKKVAKWRRDYPEIAERDAYRLYFGVPACMLVLDDFDAVYESEYEYLERIGLLTVAEMAV